MDIAFEWLGWFFAVVFLLLLAGANRDFRRMTDIADGLIEMLDRQLAMPLDLSDDQENGR